MEHRVVTFGDARRVFDVDICPVYVDGEFAGSMMDTGVHGWQTSRELGKTCAGCSTKIPVNGECTLEEAKESVLRAWEEIEEERLDYEEYEERRAREHVEMLDLGRGVVFGERITAGKTVVRFVKVHDTDRYTEVSVYFDDELAGEIYRDLELEMDDDEDVTHWSFDRDLANWFGCGGMGASSLEEAMGFVIMGCRGEKGDEE